jgi:hypothetical protein
MPEMLAVMVKVMMPVAAPPRVILKIRSGLGAHRVKGQDQTQH